jgi:hypothetical protein
MSNEVAGMPLPIDPPVDPAPPAPRLSLAGWLREGLRAGVLLRPRLAAEQPSPVQLLLLIVLVSAFELATARFEVAGAAVFDLRGWLAPQWATGLLLLIVWWVLPRGGDADASGPKGVAAWLALWMVALLPSNLVSQLLSIAQARDRLPPLLAGSTWVAWMVYLLLMAWTVGVGVRLAARFRVRPWPQAALAGGLVVTVLISAWQFPDRPWHIDYAKAAQERPRLELSQEAFETQQAVWRSAIDAIAPQRPGVQDVYGLVFSPDGEEDVFLRESSMVAQLLEERFDARGRVLQLVNNPATNARYPWATPLNLRRAIQALAGKMDRENDVLVVYLTSHGASNYRLAASLGPLQMGSVSPGELRDALDQAGIRHRVIAISACYSGGWVGPLAGRQTLVMTAADATHTSYGCGRRSQLTFFGRAIFNEQLRKTHSFEAAFAAAVPLIRRREVAAGKADGFSNPQISVGDQIRPLLQSLAQRLDAIR